MADIVQDVSPIGIGKSGSPNSAANRPVISQTVSPSGGASRGAATEGGGSPTIEQTVSNGVRGGRMLSESTREMLANLDKHGSVKAPPAPEAPVPDESPPAPASAVASTPAPTQAGAAAAPAAEPAKPAEPTDEHRAAYERVRTRNRELIAENEKLKAGPRREPTAREKALDEAERTYLDDPVAAIRRLIATVQGIDDPKHKDVDAELSGLYQDLTARELGVPVDPTRQELRESTRTRLALARDKREWQSERAAATAAPPDDPEAKLVAEHASLIGTRLSSKQADGKTVGEAYPLTMRLAERLHGSKPEALILATIREGFKSGEFDPKEHDDKLIEQAAKKIETHYQALGELFGQASPSTATPTPTADATANKETARNQVGRTITNASASVAPATPPAKQTDKPAEDNPRRKKPGETEDQFRRRISRMHLGD